MIHIIQHSKSVRYEQLNTFLLNCHDIQTLKEFTNLLYNTVKNLFEIETGFITTQTKSDTLQFYFFKQEARLFLNTEIQEQQTSQKNKHKLIYSNTTPHFTITCVLETTSGSSFDLLDYRIARLFTEIMQIKLFSLLHTPR